MPESPIYVQFKEIWSSQIVQGAPQLYQNSKFLTSNEDSGGLLMIHDKMWLLSSGNSLNMYKIGIYVLNNKKVAVFQSNQKA